MSDSLWQAPPATPAAGRYLAIRTIFFTARASPAFGFVDRLTVLDEFRIAPRGVPDDNKNVSGAKSEGMR
jgi:hypothetical protein